MGEEPLYEWRLPERVIFVRSLLRGDRVARQDASLSEPDRVLRWLLFATCAENRMSPALVRQVTDDY